MREAGGGPSTGPDPYLSLRTRFLDDALLGAVRDRAMTQVVLLAAGMDTRAFRFEWPAETVLFEVDRDDIFDFKEPVLERRNAVPRCDRRVVRADLTADWIARLTAAGFDPAVPTAFLCEGLVMYLGEDQVDRLFRALATVAVDGSWIGLDAVNADMLSSPMVARYMQKLEELGCGWHFGTPDPEGWLARFGWSAAVGQPGDFAKQYERWTFPSIPRSVPGLPRTCLITATRGVISRPAIEPVSTATAEHYSWGNACEGWHLLRRDQLSVIQERMPAGTSEVRHRHRQALQFFYVLGGSLEIEVDGDVRTVAAGSGLEVPAGLPHQVFNRGSETAEFLLISQPPSHGDRVDG
jgi:methyltransferase (TIGR00027 family)